jgi:protein-L-isoaspartate(D-aspartate) O-methyltransferase
MRLLRPAGSSRGPFRPGVLTEAPGRARRTEMLKKMGAARERMVDRQIEARGVMDARVLAAMRNVPRHLFVPETSRAAAYDDGPIPIGHGQTISQPYIVAAMTEALELKETDNVLEVGTGSGYQTAVLAEIVRTVRTVEIVAELAAAARLTLGSLGYDRIEFRLGDGATGWPEYAPFDALLVTAAPAVLPAALRTQLRDGGRLVIPVGCVEQTLVRVRRAGDRFLETALFPVRFVPLVSAAKEAP